MRHSSSGSAMPRVLSRLIACFFACLVEEAELGEWCEVNIGIDREIDKTIRLSMSDGHA